MPPSWAQVTPLPQVPAEINLGTNASQANPAPLLHLCRPKLHLPQAFCGKKRKARLLVGTSNLLKAPAETEPGVTLSCCPRAPHQADLAGAWARLCQPRAKGSGLGSVSCYQAAAAPGFLPFLHVRARPQPAVTPVHCWVALEITWGEAVTEMKTQKYEELVKKNNNPDRI